MFRTIAFAILLACPQPQPTPTVKVVRASLSGVAAVCEDGDKAVGAAVCLDARGYLVTAAHVVEGAKTCLVATKGGEKVAALVIATDPDHDLALLKVEAGKFTALKLSTAGPDLGEDVLAIGHPYGHKWSVTRGIVSCLDCKVPFPSVTMTGLVQTSAAINSGNSGGALLDMQGRVGGIVIGMHCRANCMGYAVSAADVKEFLKKHLPPPEKEK